MGYRQASKGAHHRYKQEARERTPSRQRAADAAAAKHRRARMSASRLPSPRVIPADHSESPGGVGKLLLVEAADFQKRRF